MSVPFRSVFELPSRVRRHLPPDAQLLYMREFNRAWEAKRQHGQEPEGGGATDVADPRNVAHYHRQAWAAVKKEFEHVPIEEGEGKAVAPGAATASRGGGGGGGGGGGEEGGKTTTAPAAAGGGGGGAAGSAPGEKGRLEWVRRYSESRGSEEEKDEDEEALPPMAAH